MRDSLLRVLDDLQTKYHNETEKIVNGDYCWGIDELQGRRYAYAYAIQELRKVLDDHSNI